MLKTNYHTHSTFCDGNNTPEEMVKSAIKRGFDILGFSSHSMYPYSSLWHVPAQQHSAYSDEIRRLQREYTDKIKIYLGFEVDYIHKISVPSMKTFTEFSPDYLIGSVHFVQNDCGMFAIDDTTDNVRDGIKNIYNNDGKQVVCDYFEAQRHMLQKGDFLIWGHPDLVRKRNATLQFFSEQDNWYCEQLKETAKTAAHAQVIAEINTGAIARGAMDDVYPSPYFLQLLHDEGVPVTISSDAHTAQDIDCSFDRALAAATNAGYREIHYFDNGSIKSQAI